MTQLKENLLTENILGAAIEVHRCLGPGLLESSYETCLVYELRQLGLNITQQESLPILYKGLSLDCGYRLDIVVENQVILEIKAVDELAPIHQAQLLSYLRLSPYQIGLLINFNVRMLTQGIRRFKR